MTQLQVRFGNLVAAHRRRCGLTQAALAERIDLSEDMIARIEAGRTGASFKTIERLARALNVPAAALLDDAIGFPDETHPELAAIRSRLSRLTRTEAKWVLGILEAALAPRK